MATLGQRMQEAYKKEPFESVWDFVTAYYPDYHGADEIAWEGDYQKILDNEAEEGSASAETLAEILAENDGDMTKTLEQVSKLQKEALCDIYERSIESFIEQMPSPVTVTFIFGTDAVNLHNEGLSPTEIEKILASPASLIGEVKRITFPSEECKEFYLMGMADADGYDKWLIDDSEG